MGIEWQGEVQSSAARWETSLVASSAQFSASGKAQSAAAKLLMLTGNFRMIAITTLCSASMLLALRGLHVGPNINELWFAVVIGPAPELSFHSPGMHALQTVVKQRQRQLQQQHGLCLLEV